MDELYQLFTEKYPEVVISQSKIASIQPGNVLLNAQIPSRVCLADIIKILLCRLKHCQKCILTSQPILMNSLNTLLALYLLKIIGIISTVASKTEKFSTLI